VIAKDPITAWRLHASWISDHQVDQDLVISRALAQIFGVAELGRRLAFRGGTAFYKLYLRPSASYSEGIDLVHVVPEPIGDTLTSGGASAERVVSCLDRCLREEGRRVTHAAFEENLAGTLAELLFRSDMAGGLRLGHRRGRRLHHGERPHEARRRAVEGRGGRGRKNES